MVIRGNKFIGGRLEEKLVSLIDIPKTLMSSAGCHTEIQGRDLRNIGDDKWENAVYIQISESFVGRAIRTDRYKYVVYDPCKNPWNESKSNCYREKYLFDLQQDPLEKNNLINNPSCISIKAALRKRLIEFANQACEGEIDII